MIVDLLQAELDRGHLILVVGRLARSTEASVIYPCNSARRVLQLRDRLARLGLEIRLFAAPSTAVHGALAAVRELEEA